MKKGCATKSKAARKAKASPKTKAAKGKGKKAKDADGDADMDDAGDIDRDFDAVFGAGYRDRREGNTQVEEEDSTQSRCYSKKTNHMLQTAYHRPQTAVSLGAVSARFSILRDL